jgi:hypothetical protein
MRIAQYLSGMQVSTASFSVGRILLLHVLDHSTMVSGSHDTVCRVQGFPCTVVKDGLLHALGHIHCKNQGTHSHLKN